MEFTQCCAAVEAIVGNIGNVAWQNGFYQLFGATEHAVWQFVGFGLHAVFTLDNCGVRQVDTGDDTLALYLLVHLRAVYNLLEQLQIGTVQLTADFELGHFET